MFVVFTGGREFENEALVRKVKSLIGLDAKVYVGDCPTGLDRSVRVAFPWAKVFKADWNVLGRAAGPVRNRDMLLHAKVTAERMNESIFLMAFPGGRGTENCVDQAHELGIAVFRLEQLVQSKTAQAGQKGQSVGSEQD